MRTYAIRNTIAAVARGMRGVSKLHVTFPAGTGGGTYAAKTFKLIPRTRKDGTVTVQAFRSEWTLQAVAVFHPEVMKADGSKFKAFIDIRPVFSRYL